MAATSSFRFPKRNRLLDAAAFGRVFKQAAPSRDRVFTVLCRPNKVGQARLGLAISKKNCKLATQRNRIKRIIRESFRRHQAELEGLDFVVMNKPEAAKTNNKLLFESLDVHWRRCSERQGQ